jgi:hypothetical protein
MRFIHEQALGCRPLFKPLAMVLAQGPMVLAQGPQQRKGQAVPFNWSVRECARSPLHAPFSAPQPHFLQFGNGVRLALGAGFVRPDHFVNLQ